METKKNSNKLSIKDFVSIFLKRKWYFIASFLFILIIGLVLTFISEPQYRTGSILKPLDNYYNNKIYEYYPEDAQKLWIIPGNVNSGDFDSSKYRDLAEEIKSDNIIELVKQDGGIDISNGEIREMINVFIDREAKYLRIYTLSESAELSFKLNESIIKTYTAYKNENSSRNISSLLLKIENEINKLQEDILACTGEKDSSGLFILNSLEEMKYNLESNRDFFNTRITVYENPVKPSEPYNINYLKNIIIIILSAIVFGLIVVYIPGMFSSFKRQ